MYRKRKREREREREREEREGDVLDNFKYQYQSTV